MDVRNAVAARRSVRGFLDTPVDVALIERLAIAASRTASGGNLQPWHIDIVAGEAMNRLKGIMLARLASGANETPEYPIYPDPLPEPYKGRRFAVGEAMYAEIGIPREDRAARRMWFARNFAFFGAPAAFFVTIDKAAMAGHRLVPCDLCVARGRRGARDLCAGMLGGLSRDGEGLPRHA
jgi:nitroreductase